MAPNMFTLPFPASGSTTANISLKVIPSLHPVCHSICHHFFSHHALLPQLPDACEANSTTDDKKRATPFQLAPNTFLKLHI